LNFPQNRFSSFSFQIPNLIFEGFDSNLDILEVFFLLINLRIAATGSKSQPFFFSLGVGEFFLGFPQLSLDLFVHFDKGFLRFQICYDFQTMERILQNFIKSRKQILWVGSICFILRPFFIGLEKNHGLRYSRVAGMKRKPPGENWRGGTGESFLIF